MMFAWPFAAIVVAMLAWDGWSRHLRMRGAIEENRIRALETSYTELSGTGKVLADHLRRITALERLIKSEGLE